MTPNARQERLLVQELGEETIIYDQQRDRVHRLNRTAALVWRHCDGQHTVPDLAALLGDTSQGLGEADVVWLALDRLEKAHLLQERLVRPVGAPPLTRRDVLRKAAQVGGLTLLLPVIQSMVAPTPAMAASIGCTKRGHTPTLFRPCCPGLRVHYGRCGGRGGF
jgi:hypothetical protein